MYITSDDDYLANDIHVGYTVRQKLFNQCEQ